MIIQRNEKNNKVELNKANYHTRQYLIPHASMEVERLQKESECGKKDKYYLLANSNSRGINFDPEVMPRGLEVLLEPAKYREIICTVNEIIQRTVYEHKRKELSNKHVSPLYFYLMLGLMVIIGLLLLNSLRVHSQGTPFFTQEYR
jgi:hypothetical protein